MSFLVAFIVTQNYLRHLKKKIFGTMGGGGATHNMQDKKIILRLKTIETRY